MLADVRAALPQLKKELGKQWPVMWIDIKTKYHAAETLTTLTKYLRRPEWCLTVAFAGGAGKELAKIAVRQAEK